ncbi:Formylglycine-generating sulfatase enzyme [Roseovarius sp. THAF27]|uniref:formylglycine-generating enzyme family protein n=1 Tax=unclassified Roseovarius TaxID=2614913 RepID=UPI001267FA82|nr:MULTISPECIES: SUMF1/EgtB/PvdO family nonheme iron enzyme [unclassified Roseovarius]QFT81353.1 Formylglycine-generating sulfatase enzyme [Roseovarius sp. THAF27]QFT99511.1 Formylglycine-generating sulfatase enzyme [Roseovarius sp. THAF8]
MTAAMTCKPGLKVSLLLVALLIIAAVLFGTALTRRGAGYDPALLPEMAATPVTLSTGAKLYVQKYEVSVAEWNICHDQGACALHLRVRPDQDARLTPATGLSYVDVGEYLEWINNATGVTFRLPTAGEWTEMAASVLPDEADPIFTDPSLTWASTYLVEGLAPRALKPRGSFSTSPEGVADLDGSVWEWTQECFSGASGDADPSRCPAFYVGGEHVTAMSYLIRDPARGGCAVGSPPAHLGMRLVSDTEIGTPHRGS